MASVEEALARRRDSARSALGCAIRVACSSRGSSRLDITCRETRAGYGFTVWADGASGGGGESWSVMDGPRPLDALLDMFPSVGASLGAGDDADGVLGEGVVRAELVGLVPFGRGETATIALHRAGRAGSRAERT